MKSTGVLEISGRWFSGIICKVGVLPPGAKVVLNMWLKVPEGRKLSLYF